MQELIDAIVDEIVDIPSLNLSLIRLSGMHLFLLHPPASVPFPFQDFIFPRSLSHRGDQDQHLPRSCPLSLCGHHGPPTNRNDRRDYS
jgi:hypothetical protein